MVDESVISAVRRYLAAVEAGGVPVRFGVVFGSQAAGTPSAESDIDVVVVSPAFDPPRDRRLVDLLWHLSARVDSRIEPVPCGERQWQIDDTSALIETARREGERVALAA